MTSIHMHLARWLLRALLCSCVLRGGSVSLLLAWGASGQEFKPAAHGRLPCIDIGRVVEPEPALCGYQGITPLAGGVARTHAPLQSGASEDR